MYNRCISEEYFKDMVSKWFKNSFNFGVNYPFNGVHSYILFKAAVPNFFFG